MDASDRRAVLTTAVAGGLLAAAAGTASAQPGVGPGAGPNGRFPGGLNAGLTIVRVEGDMRSTRGDEMQFFVDTGSDAPAVATLADNNGFPAVRQFYVKGVTHRGRRGVLIHVFFAEQVGRGVALALNVLQAGGNGDWRVYPA